MREVGVGRGVSECEFHVDVCCFIEIREEVEASKSIFCCVFFIALEDESAVV